MNAYIILLMFYLYITNKCIALSIDLIDDTMSDTVIWIKSKHYNRNAQHAKGLSDTQPLTSSGTGEVEFHTPRTLEQIIQCEPSM